MTDLVQMAAQLAEQLTETLAEEEIRYLDVLDALASAGLVLAESRDDMASRKYRESAELEGLMS